MYFSFRAGRLLTITQRSTKSVAIPYFDESDDLGQEQEYIFQPDVKSVSLSILISAYT